ncbi:MAG: PEP-CTERM sorting domain-containing protein [Tepidisphaeraceae bacterium]
MHRKSTWAGLALASTGIVSIASAAGPFAYDVVFDDQSALVNGLTLGGVGQVVIGENGNVGAVVFVGDDFQSAVVYNATPGNANTQGAAVGVDSNQTNGDAVYGSFTGPTPSLALMRDLAVTKNGGSGTLLTFTGKDTDDDYAVLQFDPVGNNKYRVAHNEDGYDFFGNDINDGITHQTNASGTVVFGASLTATNNQALVRRFQNGVATLIVEDTLTPPTAPPGEQYQNFNEESDPNEGNQTKRAITSSGSVVFVGNDKNDSGTTKLVDLPGNTQRVEPSDLASGYTPDRVVAATDTHTLFIGTGAASGFGASGDDEKLYWRNGANAPVELATYERSPIGTNEVRAVGQMNASGEAAYFAPTTNGLDYAHVGFRDATTTSTIAQLGNSGNNGLDILAIGFQGPNDPGDIPASVPMINSNGAVVFDAVIDRSGTETQAFLVWDALGGLNVLVEQFEVVQLDLGSQTVSATIEFLLANKDYTRGATGGADADIFKDGFNDAGQFAFSAFVSYMLNDNLVFSNAVILASIPEIGEPLVPEPATTGVLALTTAAFLARRRRS